MRCRSFTLRVQADEAAGIHVKLTPEEKKYLDEPYTPRPIVSMLPCEQSLMIQSGHS